MRVRFVIILLLLFWACYVVGAFRGSLFFGPLSFVLCCSGPFRLLALGRFICLLLDGLFSCSLARVRKGGKGTNEKSITKLIEFNSKP